MTQKIERITLGEPQNGRVPVELTCESCMFWHARPRQLAKGGGVDLSIPQMGECRAHPPHGWLIGVAKGPNGEPVPMVQIGYNQHQASVPACGEHAIRE